MEDSYDALLDFGGPQGIEPLQKSWHFLQAAEEVVRAGVFLEFCAPGIESVSPFHLSHLFIDWSELVGLCLFACWGCWFGVFLLLFHVADQSLRSSCLPMTILAQLYDCHSCYDERSSDQKKRPVKTRKKRVKQLAPLSALISSLPP